MDVLIKEILNSPTVTKVMLLVAIVLLIVVIAVLIFGGKYLLKFLSENYKVFRKEIKLMNYKIDAQDHALAHSFKNGYQSERDRKFHELKDNDDFVNDK